MVCRVKWPEGGRKHNGTMNECELVVDERHINECIECIECNINTGNTEETSYQGGREKVEGVKTRRWRGKKHGWRADSILGGAIVSPDCLSFPGSRVKVTTTCTT